jgi:hypothetical protein
MIYKKIAQKTSPSVEILYRVKRSGLGFYFSIDLG